MAGGASIWLANKLLDLTLRNQALVVPSSFWVALFTDTAETYIRANNLSLALEVVGGVGYSRVEVRGATGISFTTAANGLSENDTNIVFPTASGGWSTVRYAALMDNATIGLGNVWWFGPLTAPAPILNGDIFRIPANTFDIAA